MIRLDYFPKNKDKFIKLIEFCKDVLDICKELDVTPVLDGSLAVFAYTKNQELSVDDVDLSCSEADFPRIIRVLEERKISYQLREWHVLQILKDELKIELDSREYWYQDLQSDYEILQIDTPTINMLSLNSLREFYRRGMEDRAKKTDEHEKQKYESLKVKYEAIKRMNG